MRTAALLVTLSLGSVGMAPGEVSVHPEGVRVHSTGQPLAEVLNQLSKAASFEVRYDGPVPSVRVFATIEGRTVSETVSRLLEGTGVTWAARLDSTGARIELLVVGGLIQASPTPTRGGRPSLRPAIEEPPPEPAEDAEPPMMEPPHESEAPPDPPEETSPAASSSPAAQRVVPGSPWSPSFGSGLPRYEPAPSTTPGWPGAMPGTLSPEPPQNPTGASMP